MYACDEEELANNKADYQRKKQAHVQQWSLQRREIFFYRPVFLSCMYGFEARISDTNSWSYQKGKGGVVSSEVKFDFRLCASNNGTSIERG